MQEKPTIVHVIDSLGRGGAETLLVSLLEELSQQYCIVLVTLFPVDDFKDRTIHCVQRYCLHYKNTRSIPASVLKLRRIINQHRPALVRAQLFLSSLIARIATPKDIPLVFSIHSEMSRDNYSKNKLSLQAEKLTYNKRHHLIGVSGSALADFHKYIGIKGPSYMLYNFINPLYFTKSRVQSGMNLQRLKIVAVGNLKVAKNYFYLLEAFKKLKHLDVSLHIYGQGSLREEMQREIDEHRLNVVLKGSCKEMYNVLPDYDLYVMSSLYEGFGIAPIEAMAVGLPLLLSDLEVLKETTHGNALFFDPTNPDSFVGLLNRIMAGEYDLETLSKNGVEIAKENYQRQSYVKELNAIYQKAMNVK